MANDVTERQLVRFLGDKGTKVHVLIVDDDRDIRSLLGAALAPESVEVVGHASNGADAIRLVGDLRPDVVVMDLMMPVMDGTEATRAIKERFPEVCVLGFTAASAESSEEMYEAGASGVFDKTTFVDLLESVERMAGTKRSRRPKRAY